MTKAFSDIEVLSQQSQQRLGGGGGGGYTSQAPRERDGPKLNDVRKSEVSGLTDDMSKASFVLWRDNLDLHLEEFADFGLGTTSSSESACTPRAACPARAFRTSLVD